MFLGSPLCFAALQWWPVIREKCCVLYLVLSFLTLALVASSFSSTVWHLILTQGILGLLLWGLASLAPLQLISPIVYGFFTGSFGSTYSGAIKELRYDHRSANPGMIVGMLAAGRGIGSIVWTV